MAETLKEEIAEHIKREQVRTIGNIINRDKRPSTAYWLSFAGEEGFRGAVIVHAEDFLTALMECNFRNLNPHGECLGMEIDAEYANLIPEHWKYKLLSREECEQFDAEMENTNVTNEGKDQN